MLGDIETNTQNVQKNCEFSKKMTDSLIICSRLHSTNEDIIQVISEEAVYFEINLKTKKIEKETNLKRSDGILFNEISGPFEAALIVDDKVVLGTDEGVVISVNHTVSNFLALFLEKRT